MTAGRHVTSLTKDWNTPAEYVLVVREFFGGWIALDPCSNDYALVGAKVEYKLPKHDGLRETWDFPTIYVNPPYGRNANGTSIKDWLLRCSNAYEQHESEIIALIPVATNTRHWQDNVFLRARSICFLRVPRLKFLLAGKVVEKGAPMSCCFVYWGRRAPSFRASFTRFGKVLDVNPRI